MKHENKSVNPNSSTHRTSCLPSARAVCWRWRWPLRPLPLSGPRTAPSLPPSPLPRRTAEKPAPLPLHQIEGNGGIFSTLSAYIVNPPRDGEPVGRPSVGFAYVNLGSDKNLEALTITESPFKRLELGYGWDHLGLGDLPLALRQRRPGQLSRRTRFNCTTSTRASRF